MTAYPPHRRGEKYRELPFPVDPPDRTPPPPVKAKRRDGSECTHLTGLPYGPAADPDPDDMGVDDWAPLP